jgi:acyl dehydratase
VTWPVGHAFPAESYSVTRADLVRYAGASGDFNPIHWSDRVASAVGLPGVVAHGMLTMALAARALTGWVGGPAQVVSFGTRFTSPVVVSDDDEGADVQVTAVVTAVDDATATVELTVTSRGQRVLGATRAVVRC